MGQPLSQVPSRESEWRYPRDSSPMKTLNDESFILVWTTTAVRIHTKSRNE